MKKIKFFLSQKAFIRYAEILVGIASLGVFAFTLNFLYLNFYITITQSEEIILMKEKALVETFNIKKFDTVIKNIEEKTAPASVENVNNIFD